MNQQLAHLANTQGHILHLRKQKAANVIEAGGMIDKATKSGAI